KALGRNDGKLPPRRHARSLGRIKRRPRRPVPTQPPRRPGLLSAPCTDAIAGDCEYFVEVGGSQFELLMLHTGSNASAWSVAYRAWNTAIAGLSACALSIITVLSWCSIARPR